MTSIPILRYVDVVIGLAATVLVVCTLVTAVTQLILASTYSRARHLRDALQDLIAEIDPKLLAPYAKYIAERLLRHPLVGRDNTLFGEITWKIRSKARRKKLPLPGLNPTDTIQREEIILLLLEWASGEGALANQDRDLGKSQSTVSGLRSVREALVSALGNNGVADPAGTAASIRARIMQNEADHPDEASQVWRTQAVAAAAPKDFAAKIHCWFDNSSARRSDAYSLSAKIWASGIAFAVVFLIQFDAVNLLHIFAQDDSLRANLVSEGELETRRYEEANDKLKTAKSDPQVNDLKTTADNASEQRRQIAESLAVLRDPNRNLIPSYLLFQKVAHATICKVAQGGKKIDIIAGTVSKTIEFQAQSDHDLDRLGGAIRKAQLPIAVYSRNGCLILVAQDAGTDQIEVKQDGSPIGNQTRGLDGEGLQVRLPGILLMWVFVSLGAPFWYDLLKNLLNFRSVLAQKDENDRNNRATQQPPAPSEAQGTPAPPQDSSGSLQLQPDLVSTVAEASLRIGTPSTSAARSRTVPANTLVHVTGFVKGEGVQDANQKSNDKWYQTLDGEYLWAGETNKP